MLRSMVMPWTGKRTAMAPARAPGSELDPGHRCRRWLVPDTLSVMSRRTTRHGAALALVLAASASQAVAAPSLSGKFFVGDPEVTSGSSLPAVASSGQGILVGWTSDGMAPVQPTQYSQFMGITTAAGYEAIQQLGFDGALVGAPQIVDSVTASYSSGPTSSTPVGPTEIAGSGGDYFVAFSERWKWITCCSGSGVSADLIQAVRVSQSGVAGPAATLFDIASLSVPAIGSNGTGWLAVSWNRGAANDAPLVISARPVASDGTIGTTVTLGSYPVQWGSLPLAITPSPIAVDSDGSDYLVAWGDNSIFELARVGTAGDVSAVPVPASWRLPPLTASAASGGAATSSVRLAWNGQEHLIVWSDDTATIRASRIASDGTVLDGDGVVLGAGAVLDLDASGTDFLLLYRPIAADGGVESVHAIRVAQDASILDPGGFGLGATLSAAGAAVGTTNTWLVVFDDFDIVDRTLIFGQFVSSGTAPPAPNNPVPPPASAVDAGADAGGDASPSADASTGAGGTAGTGGAAGAGAGGSASADAGARADAGAVADARADAGAGSGADAAADTGAGTGGSGNFGQAGSGGAPAPHHADRVGGARGSGFFSCSTTRHTNDRGTGVALIALGALAMWRRRSPVPTCSRG